MNLILTRIFFVILGLFLMFIVLVELKCGEVGAKVKDNKLASRSKNPFFFWFNIILTFFGASLCLYLGITGGKSKVEGDMRLQITLETALPNGCKTQYRFDYDGNKYIEPSGIPPTLVPVEFQEFKRIKNMASEIRAEYEERTVTVPKFYEKWTLIIADKNDTWQYVWYRTREGKEEPVPQKIRSLMMDIKGDLLW